MADITFGHYFGPFSCPPSLVDRPTLIYGSGFKTSHLVSILDVIWWSNYAICWLSSCMVFAFSSINGSGSFSNVVDLSNKFKGRLVHMLYVNLLSGHLSPFPFPFVKEMELFKAVSQSSLHVWVTDALLRSSFSRTCEDLFYIWAIKLI